MAEWGIIEWVTVTSSAAAVISSLGIAYISLVKHNITTKKDIDNGFSKLRDIEEELTDSVKELKIRLNTKAERIQTLESMLYEYLKKAEADTIYCKKETMQPIVDNVIKNQEMLYQDLKEFRNEVSGSISTIVNSLNEHIASDREFQQRLLDSILKGINK